MSVTINKWDAWEKGFIPETGDSEVTSFIEPANKTMAMVYVEVNAGIASLEMSIEESSIPGKKFNLAQFDGSVVSKQVMNFSKPGTYRIPVPVAMNEEKLYLTLKGEDVQLWSIFESEKN